MYDDSLWRHARCTKKDRKKIVPLIELLAGLAEKAMKEGLLSLEDDIPEAASGFMKAGLRLIVDGTDPDEVRDILRIRLYAGGFRGRELLERMITADGLLCIQAGRTPHLIREKLYAYLGEGFDAEAPYGESPWATPAAGGETGTIGSMPDDDSAPGENPGETVTSLPAADDPSRRALEEVLLAQGRIPREEPVSPEEVAALAEAMRSSENGTAVLVGILRSQPRETAGRILDGFEQHDPDAFSAIKEQWVLFEDLVRCDDRSLQKILREVDTQELVRALKGASPALIDRVCSNMSNRGAQLLKEDMDYIGPVRLADVEQAQNRITTIAVLLEQVGEIVVPRPGEKLI